MKTQMKFQKIICFAVLLLGAFAAVYGLCYCTGGLAAIGATCKKSGGAFTTYTNTNHPDLTFTEAKLYDDVQSFNDALLYLGIVLILLAVVLYITSTNKRRNYYVSNYVATAIVSVATIGISIYCLIGNANFHNRFLTEILNNESAMESWKAIAAIDTAVSTAYSESTVMFTLGYILYALVIVASVLLLLNLVWKVLLMKGEKKLLSKGFAQEVA